MPKQHEPRGIIKERVNKMSVKCTVLIQQEENRYVAADIASGVTS